MTRITTRQRVLDKSAELFNRFGIDAVSIGLISESLGISTGNLTYYFKKKSDLINEHIADYESLLRVRVEGFPLVSNPARFSEAWVDLLEMTRRYRFLFVGAAYILENELVAAARYKQLVDVVKRTFIGKVQRLSAEGHMKPIQKPYTVDMLVEDIWRQWLGWLLVTQIAPAQGAKAARRQVTEAVLHILFLAHHYIDADYFVAVQRELKRLERDH